MFSETYKVTNQQCAFSPDGCLIASASKKRLYIRETKTVHDIVTFTCQDSINHIEWSPDSLFVLCALHKKGLVQVWSVNDDTWTCNLTNGSLGLTASRWAPDSRHILTTTDFKLRVIVWSLINKTASYIECAKFSTNKLAFSKDGKYMVVAERRDCRDSICLLSCDTWDMLTRFNVDCIDMAVVVFSPDGCSLAVCDSKLEYKVVIYSIDGRLLFSFSAGDDIALLGVKCVTWCPSNRYLFIGSYDQKVRVLNTITWKPVCALTHSAKISKPGVLVYEENDDAVDGTADQFIIYEDPVTLPTVRPDPEKPNPKLGVGTITCCHDSSYMATQNDNMPDVVWIWNSLKLKLDSVLVFKNNIKTVSWHPNMVQLAICTGNDNVYIWCPKGCMTINVPCFETDLTNISWNPSGHSLLLTSKQRLCVCYLKEVDSESCTEDVDSIDDVDSLDGYEVEGGDVRDSGEFDQESLSPRDQDSSQDSVECDQDSSQCEQSLSQCDQEDSGEYDQDYDYNQFSAFLV